MAAPPPFPDNTALLRYLYSDLSRISQIASPSIILHRADRALDPTITPIHGLPAVQAHEDALIAATGGTLHMDVSSITANEHFGTVLGTLRAGPLASTAPQRGLEGGTELAKVEVPFCGVWRFEEGRAVEHWENAREPAVLVHWLTAAVDGARGVGLVGVFGRGGSA